jgi:O-antigen/teichoic acid export membrane protein
MAARLQVFPGSLTATLFPAFSMSAASRKEVGAVYARGLTFSLLLLGPVTLLGVVLAPQILRLWVGGQVAVQGALVLQVLVIGRFLNALSQTPASLLDGLGKPDLRAKVFLSYTPIYLALAWYCIRQYGVLGAAAACGLRSAGELIVFLVVAGHQVGAYGALPTGRTRLFTFGGLTLFAIAAPVLIVRWSHGTTTQTIYALAATAVFAHALWRWVLSDAERLGVWAALLRLTRDQEGLR